MNTGAAHCFTYGSLMCERIMFAVCAMPLAATPAVLRDFSRHPIRGEDYPGMVPDPGGEVRGVLYEAVPPPAIARLDAFEGAQYVRTTVTVARADGRLADAETYVFRPEHANLLLPGDWDYGHFLRVGHARFERHYRGYMQI